MFARTAEGGAPAGPTVVSAPSRSRGLGRLLQQVRPRDGLHGVSDPAGGPVQSFKFPLRFDSRRAASLKSAGLARKMRFAAVLPGPSAPWAGPAGEYFENQAAYRTFKALRPFAPGPSFDPHGRGRDARPRGRRPGASPRNTISRARSSSPHSTLAAAVTSFAPPTRTDAPSRPAPPL